MRTHFPLEHSLALERGGGSILMVIRISRWIDLYQSKRLASLAIRNVQIGRPRVAIFRDPNMIGDPSQYRSVVSSETCPSTGRM